MDAGGFHNINENTQFTGRAVFFRSFFFETSAECWPLQVLSEDLALRNMM